MISFPFHRWVSKTEEIDLILAKGLKGMQPKWYTTLPFRLCICSHMQTLGSEHSFNSGKQWHVNTPVLPNSIVLSSASILRMGFESLPEVTEGARGRNSLYEGR